MIYRKRCLMGILLIALLCISPNIRAQEIEQDDIMYYSNHNVQEANRNPMLIETGKWLLKQKFQQVGFFSKDGWAVAKQNGKYGFINWQGEWLISAKFESLQPFFEELAAAKQDGQNGFIDRSGKMIVFCQCDRLLGFKEGVATFAIAKKWGAINRLGEIIIAPQYDGPLIFDQGAAVVRTENEYKLINPKNETIAAGFSGGYSFHEGWAVMRANDKWGVVNYRGEWLIAAQYDDIDEWVVDGFIAVELNGRWGIVRLDGTTAVAPQYERISLRKGYAKVLQDGKWGIIDFAGNWLIKPIYDEEPLYYPKQKIVQYQWRYYTADGKKLNHYANHIEDAAAFRKVGSDQAALVEYRKALTINPGDVEAERGVRQVIRLLALQQPLREKSSGTVSKISEPEWIRDGRVLEKEDLMREMEIQRQLIASRPEDANAYYRRGRLQEALGNLDQASVDYEAAAERAQSDALPYCALSRVYARQGIADLAQANAERAIQSQPECAEAYFSRGKLCDVLKPDGLVYYAKALNLKLDYAEAYLERGRIFAARRQDSEAADAFSAGIEVLAVRNEKKELLADLYYRRANILRVFGRSDEAKADYQAAVKNNANHRYAAFNLAQLQEQSGERQAALTGYRQALETLPQDEFIVYIGKARKKAQARLAGDWETMMQWIEIFDI